MEQKICSIELIRRLSSKTGNSLYQDRAFTKRKVFSTQRGFNNGECRCGGYSSENLACVTKFGACCLKEKNGILWTLNARVCGQI